MTEEGLFEYAIGKGWDKILETVRTDHSLPEIAVALNMTEIWLLRELQITCGVGLMSLRKSEKGYTYTVTELGLKFLEKQKRPK